MSDTSGRKSTALVPTSLGEAQQMSAVYAKSSLLPPDLRGKEADVFVTIMAGQELGLAPMASIRSIHVVKGKPILSADAMVGVALASGVAEYFVNVESSDRIATYETKRRGSPAPQRLSFTIEEARTAGLGGGDNWKKYPAAMLRARAKAALARDAYPDALAGVYTDDEAHELSDSRIIIDRTVDPPPAAAPPPRQAATPSASISDRAKQLAERILRSTTLAELAEAARSGDKLPPGKERVELEAIYLSHRERLKRAATDQAEQQPHDQETVEVLDMEATK